jgi:hypothetical protein
MHARVCCDNSESYAERLHAPCLLVHFKSRKPSFHSAASLSFEALNGLQDHIKSTSFDQICLLILAGAALHLTFFTVNYVVVRYVLRLSLTQQKAFLIMGSQKTLSVCVTILSYFPASFGTLGLLTLPCIMGHMAQLFIDAFIVSRWATFEEKRIQAVCAFTVVLVADVNNSREIEPFFVVPHGPVLPTQAPSACIRFVFSPLM